MLFSSLTFIFFFLPVVLFSYYILPRKFRNYILLLFSLFFYGYGGPKLLVYMISSIFVNYIIALVISRTRKNGNKSKLFMFIGVFFNLSLLIYFKYANFLIRNFNIVTNSKMHLLSIALPIGISFYTFHSLSYIFDIYRGKAEALKNPFTLMLYISFFPQLVAGPIVRYETVANQLYERKESIDKFVYGIRRFITGLGKKVLIANSMGLISDQIFSTSKGSASVLLAWIGAFAYTLQIYFDFSGYSDMAIGLARMFGFEFLENFNYPYISRSITEFWRRWHISLSSWFRDYVYIPLGGNRKGIIKHLRNIFVVWLLTGFWHGASWNFIIWGLYFGVLLTIEKYLIGRNLEKAWRPFQHVYALFFIVIGWVIFRSPNMSYAFSYIKCMFGIGAKALNSNQAMFYLTEYKYEFIAAIILSLPLHCLWEKFSLRINNKIIRSVIEDIAAPLCVMILFGITIIYLANSTFNPFIYFKF